MDKKTKQIKILKLFTKYTLVAVNILGAALQNYEDIKIKSLLLTQRQIVDALKIHQDLEAFIFPELLSSHIFTL